jgi:hypothetical protein
MNHPVKSAIFVQYNKARSCGAFDKARVNRAFGLFQKGETRPYNTTISACDCPDSLKGHTCKHRIARAIAYRTFEQLCQTSQSIQINGKIIVDGEIFPDTLDLSTAHTIAQKYLHPRYISGGTISYRKG